MDHLNTPRFEDVEADYYGFENFDSAHKHPVLAEIGVCSRKRTIYLHDIHQPIEMEQQLRSYLPLCMKKPEANRTYWERVGVVTIAEYDPNRTIFGCRLDAPLNYDQQELLRQMTRDQTVAKLEKQAAKNSNVFHAIDERPMDDFTIH